MSLDAARRQRLRITLDGIIERATASRRANVPVVSDTTWSHGRVVFGKEFLGKWGKSLRIRSNSRALLRLDLVAGGKPKRGDDAEREKGTNEWGISRGGERKKKKRKGNAVALDSRCNVVAGPFENLRGKGGKRKGTWHFEKRRERSTASTVIEREHLVDGRWLMGLFPSSTVSADERIG